MNHRLAKILAVICLVGFIFCAGVQALTRWEWLAAAQYILAAGVLVSAYFNRCPHCNRFLNLRYGSQMEYCPHCGGKL